MGEERFQSQERRFDLSAVGQTDDEFHGWQCIKEGSKHR